MQLFLCVGFKCGWEKEMWRNISFKPGRDENSKRKKIGKKIIEKERWNDSICVIVCNRSTNKKVKDVVLARVIFGVFSVLERMDSMCSHMNEINTV